MNTSKTEIINGKHLYYAFIAGGNKVLQNQRELNDINVFPVSDKDTGTNLASTIRSVIDNIKPHRSYETTLLNIADAALIGARGNSGVIFAQFFYGLSQETNSKRVITISEFAKSVKGSIPYIYDAVANPVEGTILTVIKDWSNFLSAQKDAIKDFKTILTDSLETLERSLFETTSKLKELNKHGFVDAGAKGFVVFINGVIDFINNNNIKTLVKKNYEELSIVHTEDVIEEEISSRYCTEAIIKELTLSKDELKKYLSDNGESVVVAGSNNVSRIHVHTNQPAKLFNSLKNFGTITFQKVDDMLRQQEISMNRKWNIALVTDSTCDLSQELIDHYQINMVPINLNFGDNHYLDKVTIQPEHFYDLLESSDEFPKTSQINETSFTNIYSHLASNYDAVIGIHLSGKFSGTFLSSKKAAEKIEKEFEKPIFVFDSQNVSGSLGLIVLKVAKSIEEGKSYTEIIKSLEEWKQNAKIFVSVKNMKSMIRGGRVSKPKGFIANLLGLNPVISIDETGKSKLFGKTFSQHASLRKIYKHIERLENEKTIWNYMIMHAHNFDMADEIKIKMKELINKEPISVVDISPVLGMHAGIGAVAISLLFDN